MEEEVDEQEGTIIVKLLSTAFIMCQCTLVSRLARSQIIWLLIQLNYSTSTFIPNGILYTWEGIL